MKKDHAFNLSSNVRFLKQVPYINDWMDRQIQGMFHLCKEVKTDQEEAFAGPAAGKGKVGEGGGGLTPTLEKVKIRPNSWL